MALGFVALVSWCGQAHAQAGILFQAADLSGNQSQSTAALQWSHTVRAGNDLYLIVGVASQGANNDVSSVTYGTDTVASLGAGEEQGMGFNGRVQLFGLDLGNLGSDRTSTVTVNFPGSTAVAAGAMGFSGVGSVGAVTSTQGQSAAPAIADVVDANTGDLIVDIESHTDRAITASANGGQMPPQTEIWDRATGTEAAAGGRASQSIRGGVGGTSNSMNWTLVEGRRWVIAGVYLEPTYLTAIRLDSFRAMNDGASVRLDWRTGFEVDNLGFHVHRERGGKRQRITPQPILGSGLAVGTGINLLAGRGYAWSDRWAGQPGSSQYWLEEMTVSGPGRWHGPIVVRPGPSKGPGGTAPVPALPLLEIMRTEDQPALPAPQRLSPSAGSPAHRQEAGVLPATRWKVQVSGEGIVRVGRAELQAAGLPEGIDLRRLRLSRDGAEIPTRTNDGVIEFFGTGSDTPWSDVGVYWLAPGKAPSTQIPTIRVQSPPGVETTFRDVAERRERSLYYPVLRNGDAENFFGPVIGPAPAETTLNLEGPDLDAEVQLETVVQGATLGEHRIQVVVNGISAGEARMQGRVVGRLRTRLAAGVAREGENQIALQPLGGTGDISLLDVVRIEYARRLQAKGDRLRFSAPAGRSVAVGGFTTADVRVFDITDPTAPVELAPVLRPLAGGYQMEVGVPPADGRRTLLAFTPADIRPPRSLAADPPSDWARAREGADILIIGNKRFLPALEPLRALRASEGWTVAVADIEDVYDDFAQGQKTPYALRAFIEAARAWARPPRFVLLVGDATWDPRDHLGRGDFDFVPTKLIATRLIESASDDWFVTPPAGDAPDIAIGRLPVRTYQETERVVAKIVAFGQGQGRTRSLLQYADHAKELDFEGGADEIVAPLSGTFAVDRLRRSQATGTRNALLEALDRGPLAVVYFGHGSEEQWAGSVLTTADAAHFRNLDRPWLAVSLTCLTGGFHDVFKTTLAESLLLADRSGAVAVSASSTLTAPRDQIALGRTLLEGLRGEGTTLGEAILSAKRQVRDADVRRSWLLFGDPAVRFSEAMTPGDSRVPGSSDVSEPPPPPAEGPGPREGRWLPLQHPRRGLGQPLPDHGISGLCVPAHASPATQALKAQLRRVGHPS